MKFWMRVTTPLTIVATIAVSTSANANMWGTGMYGGMQACSYNYGAGAGSSSYLDEIREAQLEISEAQKQIRSKKSELKKADRNLEKNRRDVDRVLSETYSEMIFEHVENNIACKEYQALPDGEVVAGGEEGGEQIGGNRDVHGFSRSEWSWVCDWNKAGNVKVGICDTAKFQQPDRRGGSTADCKKGLTDYRKNHTQKNKLTREIEALEALVENRKEDIKISKEDYTDEQREARLSQTEGGVCIDCLAQGSGYQYQKPQTDWGSVIGNVALGLGSVYMGYRTNKMVAQENSNIGWPTDPYATVGYGYGLGAIATGIGQSTNGQSGIYGSIGGGVGAGAFGCAGNNGGPYGMMGPYGGANGQGMWGNPYAMNGMNYPASGGIFMPGMGPWGSAGPHGMMGPYPGSMGGYPGSMGGYPGSMGGYPGSMGGYPGSMGGYPGSMVTAFGGGIVNAMQGGYPGSMMGGYPGSMMTAMGGGYPGSMMGGYPGSMMTAMGGGYPGSMMGGYPGSMMTAMGGGMASAMQGNMAGNLGSLQLQQQMMQMQMQQYQQYMQQQQSFMQQEMQKQQVVSGLQSELYSLISKIQQVQYGTYSPGSLGVGTSFTGAPGTIAPIPINGGGYSGGYIGTTGGSSTLPVPVNNGTTGNSGTSSR